MKAIGVEHIENHTWRLIGDARENPGIPQIGMTLGRGDDRRTVTVILESDGVLTLIADVWGYPGKISRGDTATIVAEALYAYGV